MLLLEAIDIYGLGMWSTVAEHVGPNRSAAECKVRGLPVLDAAGFWKDV
jgi:hypothetical protein